MGLLYILAQMFAENAGKILDKHNYIKTSIVPRESLQYTFGSMFFFVASFIVIFNPNIPVFTLIGVALLGLIVVVSFVSNLFDEQSIKINDLSLREPLSNFKPILAGFIGLALFPEERETALLIGFILGAVVVAWGVQPTTLRGRQKKGILFMAIVVVLEASLKNIFVFALDEFDPEFITLFRLAFISLLLGIFYRPRKRNYKTKSQAKRISYTAGLMYALGSISSLYAIDTLGIVTTASLLLFGPALRYLSAYIFLSDKPSRRKVISSGLLGLIAAGVAFV